MAVCKKCGKELDKDVKVCPSCGEEIEEVKETASNKEEEKTKFEKKLEELNQTADTTADFDKKDIEDNKAMGILAYISILVLIPLFVAQKSKFARFHVNQGLCLAIAEVAWWIIEGVLAAILNPIGLGFISAILGVLNILFIVLAILGIVNVANGKAKELPIIGKFKLIK